MTNAEKYRIAREKQKAIQQEHLRIVESDPTYPITLGDGKTRLLKYTYGPVTRIFKKTGVNVNLVDITKEHIGDPEVFEPILREGLRLENPEAYTDPDLMDVVNMKHLSYYTACIQLALVPTEADPEEIGRILDDIDREVNQQQELPLGADSTSATSGEGASVLEFVPQKLN